jgi:hypothetical protein
MIESTTLDQLASAVNLPNAAFRLMLPALHALGFPLPLSESDDFDTVKILDWVVKQQDFNLAITSMLALKLSSDLQSN